MVQLEVSRIGIGTEDKLFLSVPLSRPYTISTIISIRNMTITNSTNKSKSIIRNTTRTMKRNTNKSSSSKRVDRQKK